MAKYFTTAELRWAKADWNNCPDSYIQQPILVNLSCRCLFVTNKYFACCILRLGTFAIPTVPTSSCLQDLPFLPLIIFLIQQFSPSVHQLPGGNQVISACIKNSWYPLAAIARLDREFPFFYTLLHQNWLELYNFVSILVSIKRIHNRSN